MDANRLPTRVLHCNIKGKRNKGKQPEPWIDNIKEDLKARDGHHGQSRGDSAQREMEMGHTT